MKKLFAVLICFIIILGAGLSQDVKKTCYDSVILIQSIDKSATGSAVVVQSRKIDANLYLNTVFSAEHIFAKPMLAVPLKYDDGFVEQLEPIALQAIYKNADTDLAIASFVSSTELVCAELDFTTIPQPRNKVFLIGCGLGEPLRYSEGLVTGLGPKKTKYEYIQTSIYTVPGDSGSPVFLNQKVIAITSSIRSFQSENTIMAANEIATCKPIKLYEPILKSDKYSFVSNEKKQYPRIMADWLWLLDANVKYN